MDKDLQHIIEIRHRLHDNPGVSGDESLAHDMVVGFLEGLKPDRLYDHVGGYGVVAYFAGREAGLPIVAFRADTDALPIGHRCGHDGHTVTMLRVAQLVAARRNELTRGVMLVFQPEEETGLGAQKIIDSGIMQRYDVGAIYAYHNIPGYDCGQLLLNGGTFAAASSGVVYRLQGRATHASTPEKGVSPGLAVAEIIERMQALNDSRADLATFVQSTLIGVRVGERAFGTAAGDAELMFTLRAFTNAAMERLMDSSTNMAAEVAQRHHLTFSMSKVEPFRATENDAGLTSALKSMADNMGYDVRLLSEPFRWSEDFANYLQLYRGVLFGIGSGVTHVELHHPDYDFPDEIIETTAQLFFYIAAGI